MPLYFLIVDVVTAAPLYYWKGYAFFVKENYLPTCCRSLIKPELYINNKFQYNKRGSFVIITRTEGILIKHITNHDVEQKKIDIHSLNPGYDDRSINLEDVLQIFNVVQLLRKSV